MAWLFRPIARVTVVASVCLLCVTAAPLPRVTEAGKTTESVAAGEPPVSIAREVRLRKLHLVRPDLIPYPIAFEVCC